MKDSNVLFSKIEEEFNRQKECLELIASENYVSDDVLKATGSILTNKYAEGMPGKRYYGGCEHVDEIEEIAIANAKKLFNVDYVNVQPHSGSQANAAAMFAVLEPHDKILGFDLSHGGHLTHGSKVNFSGRIYDSVFYGVDKKTSLIDLNQVEYIAKKEKPKLIIVGGSSYSRDWDYKSFYDIAKKTGSLLMADISHIAGLIATKHFNDPFKYCDFVTTTTHKTLRGPRGGMILVGKNVENPLGLKNKKGKNKLMGDLMDSAVFPGTQGGPLMHVIAGKAVCFSEALNKNFEKYIAQVKKNAFVMADCFKNLGYKIVSGGTDNHLFVIDLTNEILNGKEAQNLLDITGITTNKNMIPFDKESPFVTSGIRIGTPAITTRGLKEDDCIKIVDYIHSALNTDLSESDRKDINQDIKNWISQFPLFSLK